MSKLTEISDTENIYGMIGGQKIPILRKIPEMEGGQGKRRRSPSPGRRKGKRGRSPSPGKGRRGRSPSKKTVIKTKPDGTVVKTVTRSPSPRGRSPSPRRSPSPTRCGQKGKAAFFEHCDYIGTKICLRPGMYDKNELRRLGLKNDTLSSVRPNGFMVKLYEHNGSGRTIILTESTKCLKTKIMTLTKNWNDQVSAIEVIRPGGCMIL